MNLADYSAFVFDLDGTLIDSGKYHSQAFADVVFEQSTYQLTPAEHLEVFASHSLGFCPILNKRHGLSLDPARVLAAKRMRVKEIFKPEFFPGAFDFLHQWQGRCAFGLATNSPQAFVQPALIELEILDYFVAITTSDHVLRRKPNPEIFTLTFKQLGIDPSSALVFEDQLIGIEAAQEAGAQVVAIDNGQSVDFPPHIQVATWRELLSPQ